MKYDAATALGLEWAGTISVRDAYAWDPDDPVPGAGQAYPAGSVLGIEAPLWSETLQTLADVEFMAFPRLAGIAEIGWSPAGTRDWDEYRVRLATHAPRLEALGVNFYKAPEVPWP
jgi:hexosaminidase